MKSPIASRVGSGSLSAFVMPAFPVIRATFPQELDELKGAHAYRSSPVPHSIWRPSAFTVDTVVAQFRGIGG